MFWEALDAKWGVFKPLGGASRGCSGPLNKKMLDKFLKVSIEREGALQGAWLLRPVSTLFPQEEEYCLSPFVCQWQKI